MEKLFESTKYMFRDQHHFISPARALRSFVAEEKKLSQSETSKLAYVSCKGQISIHTIDYAVYSTITFIISRIWNYNYKDHARESIS